MLSLALGKLNFFRDEKLVQTDVRVVVSGVGMRKVQCGNEDLGWTEVRNRKGDWLLSHIRLSQETPMAWLEGAPEGSLNRRGVGWFICRSGAFG